MKTLAPQQRVSPETSATPEQATTHPNVIVVLMDDMQMQLLPYMKETNKLIFDKGAVAKNYFDNMTLCCPARTTLLRGQYAHNTGVVSNTMPNGGFEKFHLSGEEKSTIATWIHCIKTDKGKSLYDTDLDGKYLNNFPFNLAPHKHNQLYVPRNYVPPGWTGLQVVMQGNPYKESYYKLHNYQQGKVDHMDTKYRKMSVNPKNYLVDTMSRMAVSYIHQHQHKPYFMWWATYAPHSPSVYAPRFAHYHAAGPTPEMEKSFDEADVSDKPPIMQLPPLNRDEKKQIAENFQDRVKAVQAADEAVANMIHELKVTGEYDHTYVIFTSDNGFHEGEHRLAMGKNTPYETDIHLPFAIIGPNIKHHVFDETVGDVDMASTIAQLTGAKVPYASDGRSMVPLFYGRHPKGYTGRMILTERHNTQGYSVTADGLNEPADNPAEDGITSTEPFEGVVNGRWLYVVYGYKKGQNNADKQTEFYDKRKDPQELDNLMSHRHLPPFYRHMHHVLAHKLAELVDCKGANCR